jgi:AraC-like DNA-binding protein
MFNPDTSMSRLKKVVAKFIHSKALLALPFLFFSIPLIALYHRELVVFPGRPLNVFETYTDESEKGNSQITQFVSDSSFIRFSYKLGHACDFPFAGFTLFFSPDTAFLDVAAYDYMKIVIQSEEAKSFRCYLKTYVDNFTSLDKFMSLRFLMCEIPIKYGVPTMKIPLSEFKTPSWWFEENKLLESEMGKPNFAKTISLGIETGTHCPPDSALTFIVTQIAFGKNVRFSVVLSLVLFVTSYLIYFGMRLLGRRFRGWLSPHVVIGYKELRVADDLDAETKRITDYIAEHFVDSELSVEKLGREVGIHTSKIPSLLQKRFQMNFKQYLNIIRIEEAKRLLRESAKQVVDIAYTVGYNNIPHFNRTFKQAVGLSPNQYRKQEKHPGAVEAPVEGPRDA